MKYTLARSLLLHVRESSALSQRELAKKARTSQSVVARIELGETQPSWKTLSRLINATGYELHVHARKKPVLDRSELDDIPRILRLTPEERLLEVAQVSRFVTSARRV